MDIKRKKRLPRAKKAAVAVAATMVISMPGNTVANILVAFGIETHEVSAVSLAVVNLFQSTDVTADVIGNNDYNLTSSLQALADVEALGPDRVGVFQFDLSDLTEELQDQVEIEASDANVSVDLTAVTMEDLPVLDEALGDITGLATGAVSDVLDTVDDLQSSIIPPELLTIEGVGELSDAVDALNNLDEAISDVLEYEAEEEVEVGENGELIVDFSSGLGDRLETAVQDVVVETLQ